MGDHRLFYSPRKSHSRSSIIAGIDNQAMLDFYCLNSDLQALISLKILLRDLPHHTKFSRYFNNIPSVENNSV
jgi:hypothetical protein